MNFLYRYIIFINFIFFIINDQYSLQFQYNYSPSIPYKYKNLNILLLLSLPTAIHQKTIQYIENHNDNFKNLYVNNINEDNIFIDYKNFQYFYSMYKNYLDNTDNITVNLKQNTLIYNNIDDIYNIYKDYKNFQYFYNIHNNHLKQNNLLSNSLEDSSLDNKKLTSDIITDTVMLILNNNLSDMIKNILKNIIYDFFNDVNSKIIIKNNIIQYLKNINFRNSIKDFLKYILGDEVIENYTGIIVADFLIDKDLSTFLKKIFFNIFLFLLKETLPSPIEEIVLFFIYFIIAVNNFFNNVNKLINNCLISFHNFFKEINIISLFFNINIPIKIFFTSIASFFIYILN